MKLQQATFQTLEQYMNLTTEIQEWVLKPLFEADLRRNIRTYLYNAASTDYMRVYGAWFNMSVYAWMPLVPLNLAVAVVRLILRTPSYYKHLPSLVAFLIGRSDFTYREFGMLLWNEIDKIPFPTNVTPTVVTWNTGKVHRKVHRMSNKRLLDSPYALEYNATLTRIGIEQLHFKKKELKMLWLKREFEREQDETVKAKIAMEMDRASSADASQVKTGGFSMTQSVLIDQLF
jgi:hypothetical protein